MITKIDRAARRKSGLVLLVVRGRRTHSWEFDMITAAQREARRLSLRIIAYNDTPEPGSVAGNIRYRAGETCARLPIDVRTFWCEALEALDASQTPDTAAPAALSEAA